VIAERARADGKFLFLGQEKLYARGVTYGTFAGGGYPSCGRAKRDLESMVANEVNAIRTYTVPPSWLLDLALERGLRVMVGLPWEDHIAFLEERSRRQSIERRVREGVAACAGHPAVLCYAVGNEIPASIVRWYGPRPIERFLERLYHAAKAEDPHGLVTYANYPSTEYLELPFVDVVSFNVYVEDEARLDAYLARLHNLAGDRPLLITELGLDGRRGDAEQAASLQRQIRVVFDAGCAGAFVFAWTDEWHRGGAEIDDWAFGLTDRDRRPKPALAAVAREFADVPLRRAVRSPRVSVVVCSFNGAATLADCLDGLARLDYPDYEVILVDDGSTDETAMIGERFGVRVISTSNLGLSSARNIGLRAATGELVAYIDDDCRPDRDWLRYLVAALEPSSAVGVGGPNVAPSDGGTVEECVARAPGGPVHVLVSDREAEHLPGCNMGFRRDALVAVGGFDPQFREAGDDVDICWRLQERGWTLAFSPAAMVWHRRRRSVRAYLRQQRNYGKAEALLERKWPERYNRGGHASWSGRVYASVPGARAGLRRGRIHYGTWGSALFQSVYDRRPANVSSLSLLPEWYLVLAALAVLTAYEAVAPPLFHIRALDMPFTLALLALASASLVAHALGFAWSSFTSPPRPPLTRLKLRMLTALLCLLQPVARLYGRQRHGLTPWRRPADLRPAPLWPQTLTVWSERWLSPTQRLLRLENEMRDRNAIVVRGGDFDRWDLQVRLGPLGSARVRMAVEEHGRGTQFVRFRFWPRWSRGGVVLAVGLAVLSAIAVELNDVALGVTLGVLALVLALRMARECAGAVAVVSRAVARHSDDARDDLVRVLERRLPRQQARTIDALRQEI
jgi:O-antigen biosynthesis protein